MLLLDQGLPRTTTLHLRKSGLEAEHASDIGLSTADDRTILVRACLGARPDRGDSGC
ncbi:MAG: DUF5615 family PIN-like protein [Terriglobia bacterium]